MLESFPVVALVSTVLGFLSGIGIGGGSLLMLWLTLAVNMDPMQARQINLLFFLPAALIACLFRWKQGAISVPKVLPAIAAGCGAAAVFSMIGAGMEGSLLKKFFGILLVVTGLKELFRQSECP